ncbi:MAG: DUF2007 domain-containing protein [Verrucomicrobiales bacterium]|nr:DUF2007 domain-containing protein [Verrucomicrobiales bacterium]
MRIDSVPAVLHAGSVELEVVFETVNVSEAQLIRSRLEAAGLTPEVDPEIDPLSIEGFSLPAGGIQIKVPSAQAADARAILDAGEKAEA